MSENDERAASAKRVWIAAATAPALLWLSQPPLNLWLAALVALIPWLFIIVDRHRLTRGHYVIIWLACTVYWLISLQGLRHAHPLMFLPWAMLAAYLAVYQIAFVAIVRRCWQRGVPLVVSASIVWVALECLRNYLFTGISVLMLGHHLADVPVLIQIADLLGTYGVSCMLVLINVAILELGLACRRRRLTASAIVTAAATAVLVAAAIGYGRYRLDQPPGTTLATFALIQRSEQVEFELSRQRELEIFQNYFRQSIRAAEQSAQPIDAVVWPESMFTGSNPWRFTTADLVVPEAANQTAAELQSAVDSHQQYFLERARYVQTTIAAAGGQPRPPDLLVGCGVIEYAAQPNAYSGLVHLTGDGQFAQWYGKTHLVMFGEYVPIAPRIPGLRSLVPPGLGIATGPGAKQMPVGDTRVTPNICIETAVERITLNHLGSFDDAEVADVVVTVTNGGWYNQSSVIEHHLRCAQLVAVGCRRPLLSAANSGPTAWIDSCGRVVARLPIGVDGSILATPRQDSRISWYLRVGDWPARIGVIVMIAMIWFTRGKPVVTPVA